MRQSVEGGLAVKTHRWLAGWTAVVVLGGLASVASAARVDLDVFENSGGANVSGLDVWVDVLAAGSDVDFVFHNDSSISSIITQIYFESGLSSLIANGTIQAESSGVDFKVGATPALPPGGMNIGFTLTLASFGRENPVSKGINNVATETLTVRFDLLGSTTVDDVVAALGQAGTRIAEHIQSLPEGKSVTAATVPPTVVPVPAALGPGLALLAAIAVYRLRRIRLAL